MRDGMEEKASEMRHTGYDRRRDADRSRASRDTDFRRDKDGRDDRRRDHDRDLQTYTRAGPSRRSASPRPRSARPRSRSHSEARSQSPEDKAKPNFAPSGLLAADTKTVKNVDGTSTVLKYHEPPEARKPTSGWRLYVFKGKEQVGAYIFLAYVLFVIDRCPRPASHTTPERVPDWERSRSIRYCY